MSEQVRLDLETRAELDKINELLDLQEESQQALAKAGAKKLRVLRKHLDSQLHNYKRSSFRGLAGWVRVLSKGYVAKLAQHALGSQIAGRVVSEMDPLIGSKIAKRLAPEFLAEAAAAADPAKVRDIIKLLPADLIRDAAMVMVQRGDYILMGRFADALSAPALRLIIEAVKDDAILLHIAYYMSDKSQLSKVVQMIDNDRVASILHTGTKHDLWPEALAIIDGVNAELKGRLANIMAKQDETTLNSLVNVAYQQRLWGPVLRGMAKMNPKYYRKIVNLPAVKDKAVLTDLIQCAYEDGLIEAALPLVRPMSAEYQSAIAEAALQKGQEVTEAVLWAAQNSGRWDIILELAQHLGDDDRNTLAKLPIAQNRKVLNDLLHTAAKTGSLDLVLDFAKRFTPEGLRTVVAIGLENSGDLLESILKAARKTPDGWSAVVTAIAAVDDKAVLDDIGKVYRRQPPQDQSDFRAAATSEGIWKKIASALDPAA